MNFDCKTNRRLFISESNDTQSFRDINSFLHTKKLYVDFFKVIILNLKSVVAEVSDMFFGEFRIRLRYSFAIFLPKKEKNSLKFFEKNTKK